MNAVLCSLVSLVRQGFRLKALMCATQAVASAGIVGISMNLCVRM